MITPRPGPTLDPQTLADRLYDIALDPGALPTFIDAWNEAGLDAGAARRTVEAVDRFDAAHRAHLERAETFLARGPATGAAPDLSATLAPFDNLAAFVVDDAFRIVARNAGARHAFALETDADLAAMSLPEEAQGALRDAVRRTFDGSERPDRLLRVDRTEARTPFLFQIRRLSSATRQGRRAALVVTTQYHWQPALGQTLKEVFDLTPAEQGVVRALVQGMDAKGVAVERGTSEGTVRGQIKTILAKMNARTQSEVIRLVLSLRDISDGAEATPAAPAAPPAARDWLEAEVWKPFRTLVLPDGRRMDYHDMGLPTGAPILYTHMGYAQIRWSAPMLRLAFRHGLRVICPVRAGYGASDRLGRGQDFLEATRADTRFLLDHLGIACLPYVAQGNDLLLAADFARAHRDAVSEIVGICARPCLPGDMHYAGMGDWHRFFLSTGRHAPHLLNFAAKAAVSLAKRTGIEAMFRQINGRSPADMALIGDPVLWPVLRANAEYVIGPDTNVASTYAMEVQATESDWSGLMQACRDVPTWFVNGAEDPATDVATIARYREAYPWIDVEVVAGAGQLLIFQQYEALIPRLAAAARRA